MMTYSQAEPALFCENRPIRSDHSSVTRDWSNPVAAEATFEFGRFRVLLRQRQLVADGVPIELGTRVLDLLLVLLEANGSLVSKDELFSRVWPGIVVSEANLKVQIAALRRALGDDREFIRTEFGRGYRFTAAVRSIVAWAEATAASDAMMIAWAVAMAAFAAATFAWALLRAALALNRPEKRVS